MLLLKLKSFKLKFFDNVQRETRLDCRLLMFWPEFEHKCQDRQSENLHWHPERQPEVALSQWQMDGWMDRWNTVTKDRCIKTLLVHKWTNVQTLLRKYSTDKQSASQTYWFAVNGHMRPIITQYYRIAKLARKTNRLQATVGSGASERGGRLSSSGTCLTSWARLQQYISMYVVLYMTVAVSDGE